MLKLGEIEENFIFVKYDDSRIVTVQKADITHIELFVEGDRDG